MENLDRFETLVEIMKILRGPNGCPWDLEQNLDSLKKHLLEEVYETLEVMDEGGEELKDELGDLLLQIVFQSQIMSEENSFDIYNVIENINKKLIRRHPHIFGDEKAISSDDVDKIWNSVKKTEKKERVSILDGVPKTFPSILASKKLQSKAAKVGFDWDSCDGAIDKMEEELEEFREAYKKNDFENMKEEIGDILFSIVNVARLAGIDPNESLRSTNRKFESRFRYIEKNCDIEKADIDEMEKLWVEAKNEIG